MAGLPPLPPLNDADYVLAVFSHHSIPIVDSDESGDPRRLAELGARITAQAIAYHYFMRTPACSAAEIEAYSRAGLTDASHLLNAYGLRGKIRASPDLAVPLDDPQEAQFFFNKYIGAIYIKSGLAVVQEWISKVLDPNMPPPLLPTDSGQQPARHHSSFQHAPPPPGSPPPPPPSYSYAPQNGPINNHPSNSGSFQILATFNQMAQQRGYTVTYPAKSEGQHHMPIWSVQCCMNGEVRGEGVGKNQKQAKEMAARQAWTAMGWGNAPE